MTFLRLCRGAATDNPPQRGLVIADFLLLVKGEALIVFARNHRHIFGTAFAHRALRAAYKIPRLCRNGAQGKLQACVNINAPLVHCPAAYLSGHCLRLRSGNAAFADEHVAERLHLTAKAEFAFFRNIVNFYTDVS